ncbi:MAG: NAD-dependent epimerase/dehydratase family protein [Polyangia bacterium]|jgi:dihydroflavonol-4-reductase|nr:NAD-dependent epimerase/dehydratase family protein [Polyangia bacterium]
MSALALGKVLLTGATGHLGGRLLRELTSSGYEVRASYRPGDPLTALDGIECEHFPADLLDREALDGLSAGVDAVCHLAAWVTFQPKHYEAQLRINVEGTRLLLAAARRAGVRRFLYTATVNTLGIPRPPGSFGDEDTPFDWGPYRLGYMDSKRAAEEAVLAAGAPGFETLSVNPGTMFGPGDVFGSAGSYILEAARGRLLFALPGGTTVAHVDDVARGHRLALEGGLPGRRYILGGEAVPYAKLFGWINQALGRPGPFFTLPALGLLAAGRLSDGLRDRLGLPVPFSEGLAMAACAPLYYSSARAERELGYSARPAREAVEDAVAWYRFTGRI